MYNGNKVRAVNGTEINKIGNLQFSAFSETKL